LTGNIFIIIITTQKTAIKFSWASTFALELTATGLIIQFWDDTVPMAVFIAVFWV
jgi:amino acid permease